MSVETSSDLTEIADNVSRLITCICPLAAGRTMYGGTVYETRAGVPSTLVCGVFIYKSHVSLEFSEGTSLKDPDKLLEGKGKKRRHIKLRVLKDIGDRNVAGFLTAAFAGAVF
jgi:hypothetical protein